MAIMATACVRVQKNQVAAHSMTSSADAISTAIRWLADWPRTTANLRSATYRATLNANSVHFLHLWTWKRAGFVRRDGPPDRFAWQCVLRKVAAVMEAECGLNLTGRRVGDVGIFFSSRLMACPNGVEVNVGSTVVWHRLVEAYFPITTRSFPPFAQPRPFK